jgi:hypothetical protein
MKGYSSLITFDNKAKNSLRQYLELFRNDEKALAAYWHHSRNEMNMIDDAQDLNRGIKMLMSQGASFNKTIERGGFILINLQVAKEGKSQPFIDPLANCLGICISGFVFVVKKECWQCRKIMNGGDITLCKTCHMECYCCKKECSLQFNAVQSK